MLKSKHKYFSSRSAKNGFWWAGKRTVLSERTAILEERDDIIIQEGAIHTLNKTVLLIQNTLPAFFDYRFHKILRSLEKRLSFIHELLIYF
jgi:hypothetical protein